MRLIRALFHLIFWPPILATPLLGVWLASSWAAWANGPRWLVVLSGALLFPILPALWEALANLLRRRRLARQRSQSSFIGRLSNRRANERIIGFGDRLLLRTLALNAVFLAVLLVGFPRETLTAVGARGDWMLDGVEGAAAARTRSLLHTLSDRLQAYNSDFERDTWDDDEPLPEVDSEAIQAARRVSTTTEVTVTLPDGATGQLGRAVFTGTHTLTLPIQPTTLAVRFEDGRRLSCSLDPNESPLTLVDGKLGEVACEQLVAPEPTWRPTLHLVRWWTDGPKAPLGEVLATPDQVVRVHRNDPWLRVEVDDTAKQTLCEATRNDHIVWVGVVVEDEVRYLVRANEAFCDGFLPIDTENPYERTGPLEAPDAGSGISGWPLSDEPDPRVFQVPEDRLASIALLGGWIRDNATTELERARLVHDWVAVNVRYDVDSLLPGKRAPQDPDTVFRRRTGVCAGYATLTRALGRAADLEVVYLTGNVRGKDGELAGTAHAWNAVKVDGGWLLMDTTWDSGSTTDQGFEFEYRSAYLFTPPDVFRRDHLPRVEAWQLSDTPITRGDFLRQDRLTVGAIAQGITMLDPTTPQVQASNQVEVTLGNPRGLHFTAKLDDTRCTTDQGQQVKVTCPVPRTGNHELKLYAREGGPFGSFPYVGAVTVQAR